MSNPYFRRQASKFPIIGLVYMVRGEKLNIVVDGLGPDGRHLIIRASPEPWVDLVVKRADNTRREQTIEVTAKGFGRVTLYGRTAKNGASYRCTPGLSARCLHTLSINIVSPVTISKDLTAEQLGLLLLLLAETIKPSSPEFNPEQATLAMQYMRQSLYNRLAFSVPHYLDAPKGNPTLLGLIGSGKVIEDFGNYPNLSPTISSNIKKFLDACNAGAARNFLLNRQLFQNALAIARGQLDGPEHHPKLYGWRTQGAGSPGGNFKAAMSLQGQTFYTLTPEFIADPHMKVKDKK